MSHKIGDFVPCGECGRTLVFTNSGWQHSGINPPRHIARPVAATEDEPVAIDNAIHNLTTYTRLIASELAGADVHPNLCESVEYQIHQLWSNALKTANPKAPDDDRT